MLAFGPSAMEVGSVPLDDKSPSPLPSDEIKRRIAEKAALVAELEARNPRKTGASPEPPPAPATAITKRITADGRKLSGLASRARALGDRAADLAERANAAKAEADAARDDLSAYMRETGLA